MDTNENDNKVYVIIAGEYSDRHVDRVFSKKELADEYLDTHGDGYYLEEYTLDEPVERQTRIFSIKLAMDNKEIIEVDEFPKDFKDIVQVVEERRYLTHDYNNIPALRFFIESDSRERAIKIASERFGEVIAQEQIKFPYLRVGAVMQSGRLIRPMYDYVTGEIVLNNQYADKLTFELPAHIKTRSLFPDKK
jgi:hypothetical protein